MNAKMFDFPLQKPTPYCFRQEVAVWQGKFARNAESRHCLKPLRDGSVANVRMKSIVPLTVEKVDRGVNALFAAGKPCLMESAQIAEQRNPDE